jgi:hypothetical protein
MDTLRGRKPPGKRGAADAPLLSEVVDSATTVAYNPGGNAETRR